MIALALDRSADAALLARLRVGATAASAFSDLFVAHRQQVYALCLHLTGSAAEAEDALQDTFFAVHRGLPAFRGDARLSTWIFRIAIRAAGAVRAARRPAESLSEAVVDPAPAPDAAAASRIDAARLARATDALTAEQRIVIGLFAIRGLRHAEIAEVLGIPEGTVWSRLHLARKRLAALLVER